MKTKEELHADWDRLMSDHQINPSTLRDLIAAERACIDRAAQARAIRFAAYMGLVPRDESWLDGLRDLADRIERGELVVPEEP